MCLSKTFAYDNITETRTVYKTFALGGYKGKKVLLFLKSLYIHTYIYNLYSGIWEHFFDH